MTQNATRDMPRYKCHKEVWALKIHKIDYERGENTIILGAMITPFEDGYAPFHVGREYLHKHNPQLDGYYVRYQDGYESYSPAGPFESGYTLITSSPVPCPADAEIDLCTDIALRVLDFLKRERTEVVNEAIAGRIRKVVLEQRRTTKVGAVSEEHVKA